MSYILQHQLRVAHGHEPRPNHIVTIP